MKPTALLLSALLFPVLAAGCGTSIRTTQINAAPRPMQPRVPEAVELFTSGPPARAHVDVALLEAEESSGLSVADTAEMMHKLREKGGHMGCDAVVLGGASSRDPGVGDVESWLVENPKGRKGFLATCIVYTEPPLPAPAPARAAAPAVTAAPASAAPSVTAAPAAAAAAPAAAAARASTVPAAAPTPAPR